MKIFQKDVIKKKGRIIKKYKFFWMTLLRKEKSSTKKKWKFLGIKICRKVKRNSQRIKGSSFDRKSVSYKNIKDGIISIETIKNIISQSSIKEVSFDVFDTLLIRPVLQPTDIFYLIEKKLKKLYNIDFVRYRLCAEQKLNNPFATIDDIYNFIEKEYKLPSDVVCFMKNEELECEASLLSRRDDIYSLYEYAVKLGKRIIAISDMYLPTSFICQALKNNGYDKIAEVYVSNSCLCRKDTGELYHYVVEKEKVKPQSILHIGDNYRSDYLKAIEGNLTAIHYPSIRDVVFAQNSIYQKVWPKMSPDPLMRVLLGYTFSNYFKDMTKIKNVPSILNDFTAFVKLGVAPVVFYIAISIANQQEIQSEYKKIFFASRDGYLPKLAYDVIAKYCSIIPSEYLYAGRRAYFSSLEKSFYEYVKKLRVNGSRRFTIRGLLDALVCDDSLKSQIISSLSEEEKKLDFTGDNKQILEILHRYGNELEGYFLRHRRNAKKYYDMMKTSNLREVVFDCGYSGSVSNALTRTMGKPVDKIYLWEKAKNKIIDLQDGTKTFLLMNENYLFSGIHIMYEELFSPLEGGCVGFTNEAQPILERCQFSEKTRNKYNLMKTEIVSYITQLCKVFKGYLSYMKFYDTCALQRILYYSLKESPYQEVNNLSDICFPDPIFIADTLTLSCKLQECIGYNDVYQHTGFNNPLNVIELHPSLLEQGLKIGIHCHLYNIYLYQEIFDYLKDFPVKFDLIITICDERKKILLKNIFNKVTISNLNNLIIKVVPNKGRDIAPWLIGTSDVQDKYDLFCHIHSKVSQHFCWGDEWRKYLFDNLIKKDIVIDIINLFVQNEKLGMLFPNIFWKLRKTCIDNNIAQEGNYGEIDIIKDLLGKMHLNSDFTRKDLFFSEGTMMWYRPQALHPLFNLNLQYSDFPSEPIGVGGTIAHAIERLPAYVCQQSGYMAKFYTKV